VNFNLPMKTGIIRHRVLNINTTIFFSGLQ
jgi:hypothetical protein